MDGGEPEVKRVDDAGVLYARERDQGDTVGPSLEGEGRGGVGSMEWATYSWRVAGSCPWQVGQRKGVRWLTLIIPFQACGFVSMGC